MYKAFIDRKELIENVNQMIRDTRNEEVVDALTKVIEEIMLANTLGIITDDCRDFEG